jgi:selenocysteine-specific translation elongation factor
MKYIGFSLLGNFKDKGKKFGKKGTSTDITLYNGKVGENLAFFVEPTNYPDKIQPLIYAINMCDINLIFVNELNQEIGETILMLKYLEKKNNLFILEQEYLKQDLENILRSIDLKYEIVNMEDVKDKIFEIANQVEFNSDSDKTDVNIDHFFNVKSVGTVILGRVLSGIVKVYDKLKIYPINKDVLIKSIQINDKNFKEASIRSRVGLVLKGVDLDEITRGSILANFDPEIVKEISGSFIKNPFLKKEIKEGETYQVVSGLQNVSCKIKEIKENEIKLELFKEIVLKKPVILVDNSSNLKILGKIN